MANIAQARKKLKNYLPPLAEILFKQDEWPNYTCSHCGKGVLTQDNKNPVTLKESASSLRARDLEYWEPEFIHGTFAATLNCSNPNCHEVTQVVGEYNVEDFIVVGYDGQQDQTLDEGIRPKFFVPHVLLFPIPQKTPDQIAFPLISGFEAYFANVGGCANSVRQVAERYLDYAKVAKTRVTRGRRRPLNTHERIRILEAKDKHSADLLMAIKWIGNEGSHTGDVDRYDLDAGLRMVAKLLKDKFDDSDKRLERAMKEITKRKGKRPTQRRRRP